MNGGDTAIRVKNIFQEARDGLLEVENGKIIASHIGGFSQDFIYSFCDQFEQVLISHGDSRVVIKRIFSILIEGLQNIRIHGKRDAAEKQIGFLLITRLNDCYRIQMGNLVDISDTDRLENYLDKINKFSPEELKQTYLDILRKEFMSHAKGAGLGFITTRLKSGCELDYQMHPVNERLSLFSFLINVKR